MNKIPFSRERRKFLGLGVGAIAGAGLIATGLEKEVSTRLEEDGTIPMPLRKYAWLQLTKPQSTADLYDVPERGDNWGLRYLKFEDFYTTNAIREASETGDAFAFMNMASTIKLSEDKGVDSFDITTKAVAHPRGFPYRVNSSTVSNIFLNIESNRRGVVCYEKSDVNITGSGSETRFTFACMSSYDRRFQIGDSFMVDPLHVSDVAKLLTTNGVRYQCELEAKGKYVFSLEGSVLDLGRESNIPAILFVPRDGQSATLFYNLELEDVQSIRISSD